MGEILTHLSLLMPTFSLLYSPHLLSVVLLPVHNAPLPIPLISSISQIDFIFFASIRNPFSYLLLMMDFELSYPHVSLLELLKKLAVSHNFGNRF